MWSWRIFTPWKFQCRKKSLDKLVEECTENIDEVELARITLPEHENMCECSCTLYITLFLVLLTINIGIGYYKYMNHDKIKTVATESSIFQTTIYWTYKNDCKKHEY